MARKTVTIRVPEEAWDVLLETLEMDAQSSAFDPALRKEIARALKAVRAIEHKEIGKRWPRKIRWTLEIPRWAWDTMEETLQMDSASKWIDKGIRKEIENALEEVEVLE